MSRTIDERVVSMQFDNRQFESNVQTSLSTLEKLKRSLKLDNAVKGLEGVTSAAKKCDLSPLSSSLQTVGLRFNGLYTIADQAFRNIYNSAEMYAKRIVSAFTLDPVKTGFQEYETQINAVQTILANTQSKGTTLDNVNQALDQLNAYADKTIYNFTEMTRNIGTFTAAGTDLETSVTAIQGIANLAAVSGSTSQQASTAMYQLSQALASGTVKLMDWNSVVNAGMGGQVFQDALKETARAHGVAVDDIIKKNGSFRESLSEGWITSEILNETLMKFTMTTEGLTEAQIKQNREMLKSKGYTDEQIDGIFELGEMATNAATKVKTFTQLMDTLKEAAQSGWTQTWELLVGDFEEAKELWTSVSDVFGEIINSSSEARNNLLAGALESNWDRFTKKINEAGVTTQDFEDSVRETTEKHGISLDALIKKHGSLKNAIREGAITTDILKEALEGIKKSTADFSLVDRILGKGKKGDDVKQIQQALVDLGYDIGTMGVDGIIGKYTEAAIKAFQEAEGLKVTGIVDEETLAAMEKATTSLNKMDLGVGDLIDNLDELGGRELLMQSFKNIFEALSSVIRPIKAAFTSIFPPMTSEKLFGMIQGFENFTSKLKLSLPQMIKVRNLFKGLFSVVSVLWNGVKTLGGGLLKALGPALAKVGNWLLDISDSAGKALMGFKDWAIENDVFTKVLEGIIDGAKECASSIKEWIKAFIALPQVQNFIENIKSAFSGTFGDVIGKVKEFFSMIGNLGKNVKFGEGINAQIEKLNFQDLVNFLKNDVLGAFKNIDFGSFFQKAVSALTSFRDVMSDRFVTISDVYGNVKEKLTGFVDFVKSKLPAVLAIIGGIGIFKAISKISESVVLLSKTIGGLADGIKDALGGVKNALDSVSENLKARTLKTKTKAIKDVAVSILLIAGSLILFAKAVEMLGEMDTDVLKQGGIAIAAFLGAMAVLMASTKLLGDGDVTSFGKMIGKLAVSLLVFSLAIRILGGMDPETLKQGATVVAVFLGAMVGLMAATKLIGGQSRLMGSTITDFGKMMGKLTVSLLLFALVIKILGSMNTGTLLKGGAAILVFLGMMTGMMAATKLLAKEIPKFGSMMIALSTSLLLMTAAVAILGHMDAKTIIKGSVAITAFLGMMVGMMAATKLIEKEMPKFAGMIFAFGSALLLMTAAVAILGNMDTSTILKGGFVVTAFMGLMIGMMAATKLIGNNAKDAGKVGTMMLAFSASMLIIAGAIKLLSGIEPGELAAATLAITMVGGMFAALTYATKSISGKQIGTLVTLTVIVGALVGAMVMLTKIDSKTLLIAAASMSVLIASLSASCLMLGNVGKIGPKAFVGVGVLAALMAVVGAFAAIAIASLPAIGTKLSEFMTNLQPFFEGANSIKSSSMQGIKTLSEAILMLTAAAFTYALGNLVTFGGMANSLKNFTSFITEILPVIKDFALQLSAQGLDINLDNVNKVVGIISSLAQAAGMVPSNTFAGVATKFGGGFYANVQNLKPFANFITSALPILKDFAVDLSVSDLRINGNNIGAVVDAVSTLAEAADKAPTIDAAAGFAKFTGGVGAGGYVSIPDLKSFTSFIKGVLPVLKDFVVDLSGVEIDNATYDGVTNLCGAVSTLAEAANAAPGIEVGGAFAKFAGGAGAGAYVSVPDLASFTAWIAGVLPVMSGFAVDLSTASITDTAYDGIVSICEGISVLAEAADSAPSVEVGAAFAKFAGGAGAGTYISVPNLTAFTEWIKGVVPAMTGFAVDLSGASLTNQDLSGIKSVCESVKILAEAADAAPGVEVGLAFASIGPAIAGGTYVKVPDLTAFTNWIKDVVPVVKDFAVDLSSSSINTGAYEGIKSICEAVKILAEAADAAPGVEIGAALAVVGPAIGAGGYVKTTDLTAFTEWIKGVVPAITGFTVDLSDANIDKTTYTGIKSLCEAVKTLGEAAGEAPTETEVDALTIFGGAKVLAKTDLESFTNWITEIVPVVTSFAVNLTDVGEVNTQNITAVCDALKAISAAAASAPTETEMEAITLFGKGKTSISTDFDGFTSWITEVIPKLTEFASTISGSEVKIDPSAVTAVATAGRLLGEMANLIPKEGGFEWLTGSTGWDTFNTNITTFGTAIANFSSAITGKIDVSAVETASLAGKTLAEMFTEMSYYREFEGMDCGTFKIKLEELATAMVEFSNKIGEMNTETVTTASDAASKITGVFSTLSGFDYSTIDVTSFQLKLDELISAVTNFSTSVASVDPDTAITKITNFITSVTTALSSGEGGVGSFPETMKNLGKTGIEGFVSVFTESSDTVNTAGSTLITNLQSGIESVSISDSASSIITDAVASIEEGYDDFYDAGAYLVKGFANGIADSAYFARLKARAMANAVLRELKKAFDEHSPSRETYKIGVFFVQGFTNAIDDNVSKSMAAGRDMAESAKKGLSGAISKVRDLVENGIDSQPTIRPVLDLSAVSAGAGRINGMLDVTPSVGVMSNIGAINTMMNGRQNGMSNDDVVSAIKDLGQKMGNMSGDTYNVGDVSYDNGSEVSSAVKTLVRAAKIERRR